jgi:hypothetical protein
MGGGEDEAYLGNDASLTGGWGATLFTDDILVNMGAGNDILRIGGVSPDPYACIFLGEKIRFDGATQTTEDTLVLDAQYLFLFMPSLPNWEKIIA